MSATIHASESAGPGTGDRRGTIIDVRGLRKYFSGGEVKAVDGIDLQIRRGEIFSLLGPNGAGKSTTIRLLTMVLKPDGGSIQIAGHDPKKERAVIKGLIGVCPQEIVIYEELSAMENAVLVGRMHDLSKLEAREKARALLDQMGLAGRRDRAKNFSGGMKRRLNVVMALVHEPEIAFLDEPSAGLDPQARRILWDFIRGLKDSGMTVVLTTHDMVEADAVSDHVAIMDHGKVIATGTPEDLKEHFGSGNVLELGFNDPHLGGRVARQLEGMEFVTKTTGIEGGKLLITFSGGVKNLVHILKRGVTDHTDELESMQFRQNSLEDVFLHLTGRRLRDE
ncbi:MAG: ABC transporter ATP-binding protein [Promethearchaeota archaeon]